MIRKQRTNYDQKQALQASGDTGAICKIEWACKKITQIKHQT